MKYWKHPPPSRKKIVEVNSQNIHLFYDFFTEQQKVFDICVTCDLSNLIGLLGNIYIFMCIGEDIESAFFFRKTCTTIKGGEILTLFASIGKVSPPDFKSCLSTLLKKHQFVYLCVEELGENIQISANLKIKTHPMHTIPCAYFFYNYIHKTVSPKKCFICI
jgi:hypothetical protein